MANHVTSFVEFGNISEEAKKFLTDIDMEMESDQVLKVFLDEEIGDTRQAWVEALGAKWVYFDYIDEDNLSLVSAWSPPEEFFTKIYEKLQSLNSPDLEMFVSYEDEMPNFVGFWGRIKDYEYEEYVEQDYYERIIGAEPYIPDEDDDENYEYNDHWDEKLNEFKSSEYECFKSGYEEYLAEQEEQ